MNNLIEEIYRTGIVRDGVNNEHKIHSHIKKPEGEFLFQLISSDPSVRKTLEVGCAYGLSSLYICSALSGRESIKHIIVDPHQHKHWSGVGIANLQRAGYDFFELMEDFSEFALPKIAQSEAGTFDLVFIDGWHTFDQTLLDMYYANRLIKIGGYIVLDDCNFSSVAKVVSYFTNYPAYEVVRKRFRKTYWIETLAEIVKNVFPPILAGYLLPKNLYDNYYVRTIYPSMVALKKVREDERNWTWFKTF